MNFIVRRIEPKDTKDAFDILYKAWIDTFISPENSILKDDVDSFFSSQKSDDIKTLANENILRIVAIENDKVIGWSESFIPKKNPTIAYIRTLYIDPYHQRKGVGTAMLSEIKKHFKNQSKLLLETANYNEKGRQFYLKNGFSVDSEWQGILTLPTGKNIQLVRFYYPQN